MLAITAGVIGSALLFVGLHNDASDAATVHLEISGLQDQVHGEAQFVVQLSSRVADETRWEAHDPNYAVALKQDQEGVVAEQNNFLLLLSQLASAQQKGAAAAASQNSIAAGWCGGLTAAAFGVFLVVLWFEPRWPRLSA